jgi:hypothetical protein
MKRPRHSRAFKPWRAKTTGHNVLQKKATILSYKTTEILVKKKNDKKREGEIRGNNRKKITAVLSTYHVSRKLL